MNSAEQVDKFKKKPLDQRLEQFDKFKKAHKARIPVLVCTKNPKIPLTKVIIKIRVLEKSNKYIFVDFILINV